MPPPKTRKSKKTAPSIPVTLAHYRHVIGKTQAQVAAVVGVNVNAVSDWENGRAQPQIGSIEKLRQMYNTTLEELIAAIEHVTKRIYHHGPPYNNRSYLQARQEQTLVGLRLARTVNGHPMLQQDLADMLHTTKWTISAWETGYRRPDKEATLDDYAAILNTTKAILLTAIERAIAERQQRNALKEEHVG